MRNVFLRILGVGLAAALSAITIVLAVTGRIGLYINPSSAWFAVSMAVLCLVASVWSFVVPLGTEAVHDHDGDPAHDHAPAAHAEHGSAHDAHDTDAHGARGLTPAAVLGGVLATGVVVVMLITPSASLSPELAMSRSTGAPPLFQGEDNITLAASGDTDSFGIGEWASTFATTTNPEALAGMTVKLIGFVTPGDDGFALTRLVVTHCVIDAQTASVPISTDESFETGTWVEVTGSIRDRDGELVIVPTSVSATDEPEDPYEY